MTKQQIFWLRVITAVGFGIAIICTVQYLRYLDSLLLCVKPAHITYKGTTVGYSEDVMVEGRLTNMLVLTDQTGNRTTLPILPNTSKLEAVWAPDGAYIFFVIEGIREDTYWRVKPDGSDLRELSVELPQSIHVAQAFDISPDHSHITFDFAGRIYMMDENGENVHIVTGWPPTAPYSWFVNDMIPQFYFNPSFVDGGKKISFLYYLREQAADGSHLIGSKVVNLDGSHERDLTNVCK